VIRKFGEPVVFGLLAMVLVVVPVASSMADASAASYHWARKRPQFTLDVGDNVSGDWNTYLRRALKKRCCCSHLSASRPERGRGR
jgi:hypothetical protein